MKNGGGPRASGSKEPPNILQRTFRFAVAIVKLSGRLDERPGVGRVMMRQILRAGTSIPANVEEAQAGQSKADFTSKMSIALKEARETHLRLRLFGDGQGRSRHGDCGVNHRSGRNKARPRNHHCFSQTQWTGAFLILPCQFCIE